MPEEQKKRPRKRLVRVAKFYGLISGTVTLAVVAYALLIAYPQPLFANSAKYEHNFTVYSRDAIPSEMKQILDKAEEKLKRSPLYDDSFERRLFLTGSFGTYAFLSNKAYASFANSVPFLDNMLINKTDVPADLVYVNREVRNSRSLSGVIAHETAHLLIRRRYGTVTTMMMPTWKNEGYCEYIAGDSTMSLEDGIKRWRESPNDDTGYRYIKYHLMVKHLLEDEKLTVDQLFATTLDEKDVADRTFQSLKDLP